MKKIKLIGVFTAVLICLSTLVACQKGESTLLSGASDTEALSYSEYKSDEFRSVNAALNSFQAKLTRSVTKISTTATISSFLPFRFSWLCPLPQNPPRIIPETKY